jgi:hypothetical protein
VYVADQNNHRVQTFDAGAVRVWDVLTPAGMIFRGVGAPAGAAIVAANVRLGIKAGWDAPNVTIRAEGAPLEFDSGTQYDMSGRAKTAAGVVWEETGLWETRDGEGYVTSPDLSAVMQEIVDGDWAAGGDVAIYLEDRGLGGNLGFLPWEYGAGLRPAVLFVEWDETLGPAGVEFGWPENYWAAGYWSEYWPAEPAAAGGGAAVVFMYYQRMRRRGR